MFDTTTREEVGKIHSYAWLFDLTDKEEQLRKKWQIQSERIAHKNGPFLLVLC